MRKINYNAPFWHGLKWVTGWVIAGIVCELFMGLLIKGLMVGIDNNYAIEDARITQWEMDMGLKK